MGVYLAESIVRSTVESHFDSDPTISPGLLRLHFHDCFGCDGSVLIKGKSAEQAALPNLGLRGLEVIDDAKARLEAVCPGVVSCADILALAARDSVDLSDGPSWRVPTGRKDGRLSLATEASNLPSPLDSVAVQKQKFQDKGLDTHDLLKTLCPPNGDGSKRVALDIGSPSKFDESFFKNLRDGNAILESDQRLWSDAETNEVVKKYASRLRGLLGFRFDYEFGKAMIKMSSIDVKTDVDGEVRKVCSKVN
ncbi:unnamed protein product [Arabidopsis thaliana]|uniref:peroxidase n=1 Tax=Arabidopsis thaliana TaxID=3702 RepID=A0A7G2EI93_ARATH|nr:unnamed protein product [Arabidopsis thaliana]